MKKTSNSKALILLSVLAIAISILAMVLGFKNKDDNSVRTAGIIGLCNLTILSCNVSNYCKKKNESEE